MSRVDKIRGLGSRIKNRAQESLSSDRFKSKEAPKSSNLNSRPSRPTPQADRMAVSREARSSQASDEAEDGIRDRFKGFVEGVQGAAGGVKDFFFNRGDSTRRAEEKDPDATIAVFDSFNAKPDEENSHGELVEGVIQAEGFEDEDVQRYQINGGGSLSDLRRDLENGKNEGLDSYIEDRFTGLLDNTTGGLEEILDDKDSKITVVNQSQSVAEARVARDLWDEAKEDEEFRNNLAQTLELPEGASDREFVQALVDHIGDVAGSSDRIAESKERYDEVSRKASEAGLAHVVTSGNLGSFASELEDLGVETDQQFFRSALANDYKTVVGAVDNRNGSATFNSPNAGAEISAPGVNLEITTQEGNTERKNGTSFAAPQVAALIAQIKAANPNLSPQEIEDLIISEAGRSRGPRDEVGAGVIQPEEVLELAA